MDQQAWMDQHYPRCVRCGLRTYVNTRTGARCAEVTGTAQCPAYKLPETERPEYPYVDSLHTVVMDKSAGQTARETPPHTSHPSPESYVGRTVEHRSGHRGTVVAVSLAIVGTCLTARLTDETGHEFTWGPEHISAWTMAPWCDYCETGDHATTDCPHADHDAYDAAQGCMEADRLDDVERCCADYDYVPGQHGRTMVETHTFDCETAHAQSKVWWDAR